MIENNFLESEYIRTRIKYPKLLEELECWESEKQSEKEMYAEPNEFWKSKKCEECNNKISHINEELTRIKLTIETGREKISSERLEELEEEIVKRKKVEEENKSKKEKKDISFKGFQYNSEDYNEIKPEKYISYPLFPEGSLHLLAGKTGSCKSTLADYQALCFATGKDFFNCKITKPYKVILFEVENGPSLMKERIDGLVKGMNFDERLTHENFKFFSIRDLNIDINNISEDSDWRRLKEETFKFGAEIIVLDSFTATIDTNLGQTSNINVLYKFLCNEFLDKGITIIGICEMNKFSSNRPNKDKMLNDMKGNATLGYKMATGSSLLKQKIKDKLQVWYIPTKVRKGKDQDILSIDIDIRSKEETIDSIIISTMGTMEEIISENAPDKCADWIEKYLSEHKIKEFNTSLKREDSLRNIITKNTNFKQNSITNALKILSERKKIDKKLDAPRGQYIYIF